MGTNQWRIFQPLFSSASVRIDSAAHEPATTEPSHRDRDVWAGHAGELGQVVVTHRHDDRVPAADAALASARCGQTKQQAAESLLRPAMRHHLDSMLGVCQPQA